MAPSCQILEKFHGNSDPPYLDGDGYVSFRPNDADDPRNWSTARCWVITFSATLLAMNANFASSAPSACIESISETFGVSKVAAGLTTTLFLLGFCAGSLIVAPLSEFKGRKWIFYVTFLLYITFTFLCAFAPNFASLLVGRFITGVLVSSPLSNTPGVISDIWYACQRGNAVALFSAMTWLGTALGPVVGGFMELKKDWRWTFYVLLWLGGGSALFLLLIPETHGPTILRWKAQGYRKSGKPAYKTVRAKAEDTDPSLVEIYKVALTRPWILLFDTISLLCAIYISLVITLYYMLFDVYSIVFQERRGWNAGVGQLPLLGIIVGAVVGGIIVALDTRRMQKKAHAKGLMPDQLEPEERLVLGVVGGIIFAISMFWFAWSAEYKSVHWIVPTIAGSFLSMAMLLIFVAYINYLMDTYLLYAASAIAANTIARFACSAAAPLFTKQMFGALGVGGGGSLIGGVAVILTAIPFLFWKYGRILRLKSKYATARDVSGKDQKDGWHDGDPTRYNTEEPEEV
ncbi:hypothetical protein jhhlp_005378 [Lomentospora prolificans]|uniref:Major facilitator superfamily (MFS) profile domain-containing protein n=1 Tax=Lomentospora prolificans TaxID=41688 RepID=A0A2N3N6M8_9PEZI|nr:hypothetical protein jhhlp_005378 [Lomentospora prolificans]